MEIGKSLTSLRKNHGLSRQEVADELEISIHTYIKYENESVKPPLDTLCKLADFYGVTTDYLLGRNTEEQGNLDKLTAEFNMTSLEKKIVEEYLSLPQSLRGDMMNFLEKAVSEVISEDGGN